MACEAVENPAANTSGGAGIQAAQLVVERGAQALVTGSVGPNAYDVLQAAQVGIYPFSGGTVREAVEAFKEGRLQAVVSATGPAHGGMGRGRTFAPASMASREAEITDLQQMAVDLRQRLTEVVERLDRLESER